MRKKIIRVGRSLAIIIDKPICSLLEIRKGSLVDLSLDQELLLMRPIREQESPKPRVSQKRALVAMMRSLDAHGMLNEHFRKLAGDGRTLNSFVGAASAGQAMDPAIVKRLEECLDRREKCHEPWEATLEAVMARTQAAVPVT